MQERMTFQEAAKRLHEIEKRAKPPPPKLATYRIQTEKFGVLLIEAHGIKDARRMAWQRFRIAPRDVWRTRRCT